ncbi:hypothetical protein QQS21_012760 [Conoideocrella luteorostrata]|uniref:Uncharacterized protein n=1 Tax=Conoideocrella luteorostrata TaxID=1105319 RepID=A0AAJ0CCW9_9HYPO|nr:hypothetical protein QQS21_012760 [Conoideocrella luteorostrata]
MKLSAALLGAFATIVSAAPVESSTQADTSAAFPVFERANIDVNRLNRLNFKQQDLSYLLKINNLDMNLLQQLGRNNNFNVLAFQDLFNVNNFNIASLLQFQQLQTILAIAGTGVFNQFNLAGLNLGGLNLGLINGIGGFDVAKIIDVAVVPQIQTIVSTVTPTVII